MCPEATVTISIEAQSTLGWERYVGRKGKAIGIDSFGESGPAEDIMRHFGFTANRISDEARALLG